MSRASPHVRHRLAPLASPAFVTALSLLLLNDWLLKPLLHDGLTGKLSDFTGLFVFATLLLMPLPHRRWLAPAAAVLLFAWWKSPLSQPFIELCNSLLPLPIHRTVDYSDLLALMVLPFAWVNVRNWQGREPSRFVMYPAGIIAVLAVCGTSFPSPTAGGAVYLQDAGIADEKAVDALYASIADFAQANGFALQADRSTGNQQRYSSEKSSLEVNYEPTSSTLYYRFTGGSQSGVEERRKAFTAAIAAAHPEVRMAESAGWRDSQGQHARFIITLPAHGPAASGCESGLSTDPDVRLALDDLDRIAKADGLTQVPPRYSSPCGANHAYVAGPVLGPYADSRGLRLEAYGFHGGSDLELWIDMNACCGFENRGDALVRKLQQSLSQKAWHDPDVSVGEIGP